MSPKPDANRLTPIRTNDLNNKNYSSSTVHPTLPSTINVTLNSTSFSSSSSTTTTEQRRLVLPNRFTTNQFKPISDNNIIIQMNINSTSKTRPITGNNILALQENFKYLLHLLH